MSAVSENDELVPISALQHFAFCERQCALIHLERVWVENELTAEGRVVHERVDLPGLSGQGRVARAVQLRSDRLGLVGRADVVELVRLQTGEGPEVPFPIEYKRGRAGHRRADRIQLCAQAIALEEMTEVEVPRGALFYSASRRRVLVEFTMDLRAETEACIVKLHEMFRRGAVPRASLEPKCRNCSLREPCQPLPPDTPSVDLYVQAIVGNERGADSA